MIVADTISLEEAAILEYKSNRVKILALIDLLFSFVYVILSPFFAISAFITMMFAYCGYMGSKNYIKNLVLTYNIYFILENIIRFVLFVLYLFNPALFGSDQVYGVTILFNTFIILIYVYLGVVINDFYQTIKKYTQDQLTAFNNRTQIVITHGELV